MAACAIPANGASTADQAAAWPTWWRMIVVALAVLSLCSCRGVSSPRTADTDLQAPPAEACAKAAAIAASHEKLAPQSPPSSRRVQSVYDVQPVAHCEPSPAGDTLPPSAFTGSPHDGLGPDGRPLGGPPMQWAPPGIARPWPPEEYIGDGGDRRTMAVVGNDFRITGLEPEDTLAHFETVDGRTLIAPSNHVKLYAPRFAAVRRVSLVNSYDQEQQVMGTRRRREASTELQKLPSNTVLQPVGARGETGRKNLIVQQQNRPSLVTENQKLAAEAINRFKPYEDLSIIRIGQFVEAEKAMLAARVDAAIVWTRDQGAQVTLNGRKAVAAVADRKAQTTYTIDSDTCPRLRLVKIASTDIARPGDIVEFTLRYDNTGDEVIGNVTIVDSLTTRLEYVPDSASASAKATFGSQENDAQSLELRWEITEPLKPGQGGILRFKCRVR